MRRWLKHWRARWPADQGSRPQRLSLRREWWIFSTLVLAATWWLAGPQQLERANVLVHDLSAPLQQRPASPDIVLIAIDEPSLAAIGRWPWRRAIHAQLLNHLSAQQPRAIGLDILFSEPDLDYPTDDALLARAIADSGRVVLPVAHNASGHPIEPLPALARAAAALGHVQLGLDADGGVRHFAPRLATTAPPSASHTTEPALHLGLRMSCLGQPQLALCQSDATPRLRIGFAAGDPAFTTYSYIDVVRGTIPASAFRGKYVLVGSTATGLAAPLPTPGHAAPHTPSVTLVAHILNGVLQGTHAVQASDAANRLFNMAAVAAALVALALLGPSAALAACAALWVSTLLAAGLTPWWGQLSLSPAAALLWIALAYPLWGWRRLNAAARFLEHEMRDLAHSGVLAPLQPQGMGQDLLAQRIEAVEQASRQLRELHHFVSESLLQLPSPTLVCDREGRILLANSAAHRYAQALQRPLQAHQPVQSLLAGAHERNTQQPLLDLAAMATAPDAFQREGTDCAGQHLLLVGRPFSAPPTHGWLLTLVDITHMRQAMAQRDQAMNFISHDMRAPIGAIVTLLEMRRSFGTAAAPATTHAAPPGQPADTEARIERYARTALAMADDFVHLAHAQQQPPRQEALELGFVLEQAVDDSWAAAQAKGMHIDWMPIEPEAWTTGDPSQLRRVMVNLLSNAIKYSPAGSTVYASLHERPAHWVVSIRDEGDGISPEQQATLFAPFTRLAQHEHSSITGVGLGLAFVHTVMQRHGAPMELESTVGEGTTFRLVFAKRAPDDSAA